MKQLIIDKLRDFSSRKLFAVIISSYLLWHGKIDQITWMVVMAAYMGANIADKYFDTKGQAK